MSKSIMLEIQQMGSELVICIPAEVALAENLTAGQSIAIQLPTEGDNPVPLSLDQKLARYDPDQYGDEAMAAPPIGAEIIR